jgi:pilus assembly protein Flp/PilA
MLAYAMTWAQLKADRRGVTALEYGIIAGLISIVIVAGAGIFGGKLLTVFTTIGAALP